MNDRRQPPRSGGASDGHRQEASHPDGRRRCGRCLLRGNVLAACGDDDDERRCRRHDGRGGTTAGTTGAGTSPATTPATGGGAALDKLRLGFAYIGPINDNGWTQEHHRGRQFVFDTLGDKVEGTYVENVLFDPAQTTPIFEDLARTTIS